MQKKQTKIIKAGRVFACGTLTCEQAMRTADHLASPYSASVICSVDNRTGKLLRWPYRFIGGRRVISSVDGNLYTLSHDFRCFCEVTDLKKMTRFHKKHHDPIYETS